MAFLHCRKPSDFGSYNGLSFKSPCWNETELKRTFLGVDLSFGITVSVHSSFQNPIDPFQSVDVLLDRFEIEWPSTPAKPFSGLVIVAKPLRVSVKFLTK